MTTADYPRCETCRFFDPPTGDVIFGNCKQITDVWCGDIVNAPNDWVRALFKALLPDKYEGDDCIYLMTLSDFGCVMHEPRVESTEAPVDSTDWLITRGRHDRPSKRSHWQTPSNILINIAGVY